MFCALQTNGHACGCIIIDLFFANSCNKAQRNFNLGLSYFFTNFFLAFSCLIYFFHFITQIYKLIIESNKTQWILYLLVIWNCFAFKLVTVLSFLFISSFMCIKFEKPFFHKFWAKWKQSLKRLWTVLVTFYGKFIENE